MEYKLIAMDLDGTTLLSDGCRMSERVCKAVAEAHRRGATIVIVTGRLFPMLPPSVRKGTEWGQVCVLGNGGEVRDLKTGTVLAERYMSGSKLLPVVELARRLELPVEVFSPEKIYLTQKSWDEVMALNNYLDYHRNYTLKELGNVVPSLEKICMTAEGTFIKGVLPLVPSHAEEKVNRVLTKLSLSFAWTGSHTVEISSPETTKATGIMWVCRQLNIDLKQVMAIGDDGNDIPLLKAAGLGVAMGTAHQEVKDAADVVTASNEEDGVALAIEKYVLHSHDM